MPLNDDVSDQRRKPRQTLQVYADYKKLNAVELENILAGQGCQEIGHHCFALPSPPVGMLRAQTLDLSVSGLRLAGADLEPGSAILLDLHLPDERSVVKALVEVVWASKKAPLAPQVGLRFAAMRDEAAKRVRNFLGFAIA